MTVNGCRQKALADKKSGQTALQCSAASQIATAMQEVASTVAGGVQQCMHRFDQQLCGSHHQRG